MAGEITDKSSFRDSEEDDYRSIDSMAVIALLGGILSSLACLFSPIFLLPGILGVIFGASALLRIKRSGGILSGEWLATLGIGLSILFGTFYLVHIMSRDARMKRSGREFAEQWLDMLKTGRHNEAHQLTIGFFNRVLPGTDLEKHYSPNRSMMPNGPQEIMEASQDLAGTPYQQKKDFFTHPTVKLIVDHAKDGEIRFVRDLESIRDGKMIDMVVQEFELQYEENSQPVNHLFMVTMKREDYPGNYGAQWAVDLIDNQRIKMDRTVDRNPN